MENSSARIGAPTLHPRRQADVKSRRSLRALRGPSDQTSFLPLTRCNSDHDEDPPVRQLAVRMLTWTGYRAIEARHGREALAAIEQHNGPVHLVLTDIKMPGMNGRELGRHVEERWPGKPILYMSGFASEVFQGGLLEAGAPFLAKPFTQEDLAAKVRALLESAG